MTDQTQQAPFDIEAMLTACVPGGHSCDPQHVADAIRAYCGAATGKRALQVEASGTAAQAVGTLTVSKFRGHLENHDFDYTGSLPDGSYTLYAGSAPAAPAVGAPVAWQSAIDALEAARNGLQWYRDMHHEHDSGSDDEMFAQIDAALRDLENFVPTAASLREQEADMFWDADDTERFAHSLHDIVIERDSDAGLSVGDEIKVQRAHRLPNVTLRVTAVPDQEGKGDYDWEEIDAQRLGREKGNGNG